LPFIMKQQFFPRSTDDCELEECYKLELNPKYKTITKKPRPPEWTVDMDDSDTDYHDSQSQHEIDNWSNTQDEHINTFDPLLLKILNGTISPEERDSIPVCNPQGNALITFLHS